MTINHDGGDCSVTEGGGGGGEQESEREAGEHMSKEGGSGVKKEK